MRNIRIPIQPISQYRSALMGVAILWIVLFHAPYVDHLFGNSLFGRFMIFIMGIGYIGVDVFFFLSGFGLLSGWIKGKTTAVSFYKRRLLRIFPSYWFLLLMGFAAEYLLGKSHGIGSFLQEVLCVNFLLFRKYDMWFVACILLCYLYFPIYVFIFLRAKNKLTITIAHIVIFLLLSFGIAVIPSLNHLLIFTTRLPAFIIGIYVGYVIKPNEDNVLTCSVVATHIAFLFTGLASLWAIIFFTSIDSRWEYGLWWYPCILIPYSFSKLLAALFERVSCFRFFDTITNRLSLIGNNSFEIYVSQILLNRIVPGLFAIFIRAEKLSIHFVAFVYLLVMPVSVLIGIGVGETVSKVKKQIRTKLLQNTGEPIV